MQFAEFTREGPTPGTGAIVRVTESGLETILSCLSFPTSIDFDEAGDAYLATGGAGPPGSGKVVRFEGLSNLPAKQMPDTGGPTTLLVPAAGAPLLGFAVSGLAWRLRS